MLLLSGVLLGQRGLMIPTSLCCYELIPSRRLHEITGGLLATHFPAAITSTLASRSSLPFYLSAKHIPGAENIKAEAGSRVWLSQAEAHAFTNLCTDWTQVTIPMSSRKLSQYSPWLPRDTTSESTAQLDALPSSCRSLGYDPGLTAQHALPLCGIRRFASPTETVFLRRIYNNLDVHRSEHQPLWGGLRLAYFFLLRRSENRYIGKTYQPFVLRLSDIQFCGDEGQEVNPREAVINKNNQFGREEFRFQYAFGHPILCPVRAARWIKKAIKSIGTRPEEPVLKLGKRGGISSRLVERIFKRSVLEGGLDPARFSTHSVRIGGATQLLSAGADHLAIKLLGRWLSSRFEDYPLLTSEGTALLSKLMCQ
ncbi:LOW QUALITY PROTEIN: hypothetical protein PHMEG_00013722 [Phytophthora megakarya]|uniref:Tyr recombinase domain-containing protein n=1 Tax=Phytophthora megakarya TaxID=4795 RepID=A0A225W632_9STRA|nr:LOW QUALITY PROTEIN: hypothetical protein PHMEG_00013722 [Phytophthora megakarya]